MEANSYTGWCIRGSTVALTDFIYCFCKKECTSFGVDKDEYGRSVGVCKMEERGREREGGEGERERD